MAESSNSEIGLTDTETETDTQTETDIQTETDTQMTSTEEDIDSLLDSALDDFSKVSLSSATPEVTKAEGEDENEKIWSDMLKEALQAEPSMREIFGESGEESSFITDFTKIAEAAAKVIEGDSTSNFTDIMTETLRSLQENSELSRNQFGDPDQMANMFQELGLSGMEALGQEGNLDDIPPFLQNIMQQFLSKDVLYPSIKDFVTRYPQWLETNKETLTQEQYDNYTKQLELMEKVVQEYEAETQADSEEVKKQRFKRIMKLLQQMQALGQPPAELIQGDALPDDSSLPNLPPGFDPQQCCLM